MPPELAASAIDSSVYVVGRLGKGVGHASAAECDELGMSRAQKLAAARDKEDFGAIVGLDLADPAFWDGGLAIVGEQLDAAEAAARATGRL